MLLPLWSEHSWCCVRVYVCTCACAYVCMRVRVCACVCLPPMSLNTGQLREQEQTGLGNEITTTVLGPTLRFHKGRGA